MLTDVSSHKGLMREDQEGGFPQRANLSCDIRVAVTVPTHPGAEDEGGSIDGQLAPRMLLQRSIHPPQKGRNS